MPSDVVIVGAGPAGAIAATVLAREGVKVSLFDRARFPRAKLCGDTLNPGAITLLSRYIDTTGIVSRALPLDGMVLTGSNVSVRGSYGGVMRGCSIERRALDAVLLEHATAAGAQFEDQVAILAPRFDSSGHVNGVSIRTTDGRLLAHPARLVIAADGRESRLARAVGLARHPLRPRRWAIGAYFRNAHVDPRYGEMHVRRDYYIGVAPVPGGLTNACLVMSHSRGQTTWQRPLEMLKRAIERDRSLHSRFADAVLVDGPRVLGPMAVEASAAGMPGMYLAGDAAGFIDPITGDGLRFAIAGGVLAADVVRDILAGRCGVERAAESLAQKRRAAFGRKWAFNRAVRQLVARPATVSGAAVAARLLPAAFRAMIRYAGDC